MKASQEEKEAVQSAMSRIQRFSGAFPATEEFWSFLESVIAVVYQRGKLDGMNELAASVRGVIGT